MGIRVKKEPKMSPKLLSAGKITPSPPSSLVVIHISRQSALPSMNVAGEGWLPASLHNAALILQYIDSAL